MASSSFEVVASAYGSCDSLCMRTTIEIDRDLLEEAVRVTDAPTKSVAVKALVDEAARRRLAALSGKVPEVEIASRRRLAKDSEANVRLPSALQAELEEALEEADSEEGISGNELFRSLRKYG